MDFFDFQSNGFNIEDLFWYATFAITVFIPATFFLFRKTILAAWNKRKIKKHEAYVAKVRESVQPLIDAVRNDLKEDLESLTKQIQPNANGGKSLSDLHTKFDVVLGQQGLILATVEQAVTDIRAGQERHTEHLSFHMDHPTPK